MNGQRFLGAVALCVALACPQAWGAPDHGSDQARSGTAAVRPTLPRFWATSEQFEIVGILDGLGLTLYLDRFDDNAPVADAKVDLEIGEMTVALESREAGLFEGRLPRPLAPGLVPVVMTVTAGDRHDLLAAELDLHAEEPAAGRASSLERFLPAGLTLAAVLTVGAGTLAWSRRRRRAGRPGVEEARP